MTERRCKHPKSHLREVQFDTLKCQLCGEHLPKPRCIECHFVPVMPQRTPVYSDELNPNPVRVEAYCSTCGRRW
jgi:hypothetical protein